MARQPGNQHGGVQSYLIQPSSQLSIHGLTPAICACKSMPAHATWQALSVCFKICTKECMNKRSLQVMLRQGALHMRAMLDPVTAAAKRPGANAAVTQVPVHPAAIVQMYTHAVSDVASSACSMQPSAQLAFHHAGTSPQPSKATHAS